MQTSSVLIWLCKSLASALWTTVLSLIDTMDSFLALLGRISQTMISWVEFCYRDFPLLITKSWSYTSTDRHLYDGVIFSWESLPWAQIGVRMTLVKPKPHHQVINLSNQYFMQLGANNFAIIRRYNLFPTFASLRKFVWIWNLLSWFHHSILAPVNRDASSVADVASRAPLKYLMRIGSEPMPRLPDHRM